MPGKLERKETRDSRLAKGMDTQAMLPVLGAVYEVLSMLFLPWFSVPDLKYTVHPHTASLFQMAALQQGIGKQYQVPQKVTEVAISSAAWISGAAVLGIFLTVVFALCALKVKVKAAVLGRIVFAYNGLISIAALWWCMDTNSMLNLLKGRENNFVNLSINSDMQLTSYAYAQLLLGIIFFFSVKSLLDTKKEYGAQYYITRTEKEDSRISKRTLIGFLLIFLAIPGVIFFGIFFLNDRGIYFISLCIIFLSMLPFFLVFESRRPQAREVVVIAVMAALAVVGRVSFFMLPFFKPTAAVIIMAGVSLGAEAGFLTGALAGFVSNFFFGQGPWTPWQMFAFGIIGFLAGLLFKRRKKNRKHFYWEISIFGFFSVLFIYGGLLDTASGIMGMNGISRESFLALYISGLPVNLVHAGSTFLFLKILGKSIIRKVDRVKEKYGIIEP